MKKPDIKTASQVVPVIYAYTHPDYPKHSGCTKIGQSEQTAGKESDSRTILLMFRQSLSG